MKKSQRQTSASRSTATKHSNRGCTQISSSDLAPLLSAIQQVWPKARLPKKPASMHFDVWVSPPSRLRRTISTPDSVLLRVYWDGKSTPDQPCVSTVVAALGLFEQCLAAIDIRAQSSVGYVRYPKNSTRKASATSQTVCNTSPSAFTATR